MNNVSPLATAREEANSIASALHGLELRGDARSRVALACFAIAQQHHAAILILLSNSPPLHATAFALLRPLLEAILRGEWVSHCATDAEIESFVSGAKRQLDMSSVVQALATKLGDQSAHVVLYKRTWPVISAYTHTYENQVRHWLLESGTAPNYSEEEIAWLLGHVSPCLKLCAASIRRLGANSE